MPFDGESGRKTKSILLFLSLFVWSGCSLCPKGAFSSRHALLGTWKYQDPQAGPLLLTFDGDNTYVVDFNGNGQEDIRGEFQLRKSYVRFDKEVAKFFTECTTPGYFSYRIYRHTLTFDLIADQCRARRLSLSQPRTKVKLENP